MKMKSGVRFTRGVFFTMSLALLILAAGVNSPARACTRAMYAGAEGLVITGRSMDWFQDLSSNLWVFTRGMKRDGAAGKQSATWTSKYGSLVVSAYEAGTADGMNEKGLVANVLYLAESDYGAPEAGKAKLSVMAWAQYALDNFATVAEAVEALGKEPFQIVAPVLPDGKASSLHLSLSDPSGDSAIFEYIGGKQVIHHGKAYHVMTNSPSFDQQLAIETYWKGVNPLEFLPGSITAADRFVRATFLINAIPDKADPDIITAVPGQTYANQAVAGVLGVMRSVSTPLGIADPTKPNLASTLWRTVYDQKSMVMFYDAAASPNAFWVSLAGLDFSQGAPVKKLVLTGGKVYSGDVAGRFEQAEPFTFLSGEAKK